MRKALLPFLGVLALVASTSAQKISTDSGWYDVNGFHDPNNTNYIVGDCSFGCGISEFRDFFVFNLAGVSSNIVRATFSIEEPGFGYSSANPTETYTLFDYGGSIATLTAGTGGVTAFNDLGSGTMFGSQTTAFTASVMRFEIAFNAAGVAALNAAAGGNFAFGGANTTLDGLGNDEYIFGFSGLNAGRLVLAASGGDETYIVVGGGAGPQTFYPGLHAWETKVGTIQDWVDLNQGPAEFLVPNGKITNLGGSNPLATLPGPRPFGKLFPAWMDDLFFTVQVVAFDPELARPERTSNGLFVWVRGNGKVTSLPYGTSNGIAVWSETFTDSNGRPGVRFPYANQGQ